MPFVGPRKSVRIVRIFLYISFTNTETVAQLEDSLNSQEVQRPKPTITLSVPLSQWH